MYFENEKASKIKDHIALCPQFYLNIKLCLYRWMLNRKDENELKKNYLKTYEFYFK